MPRLVREALREVFDLEGQKLRRIVPTHMNKEACGGRHEISLARFSDLTRREIGELRITEPQPRHDALTDLPLQGSAQAR